MTIASALRRRVKINKIRNSPILNTPLGRAVNWVKAHRLRAGGIVPHTGIEVATQEVTGYLIPTLYLAGEKVLARELAIWEASVQRTDGAFAATDNVAYTFDTAQVIRGFLAVLDDLPELEPNLRRACDYVAGQIAPDGRVLTVSYDLWRVAEGKTFSEYANLYVLPPLLAAGAKLNEQRYIEAVRTGIGYFKQKPDIVAFKPDVGTLSHIYGYMMEALVELGEIELAEQGLQQAAALQREDGAIPAYPGVNWVCSTGVAQIAVAWYKLGDSEPADRALKYLETIQNPSGGFYGGYGEGAEYFPDHEISWAAKYFIDCLLLRDKSCTRREHG